jgi:hypothetical protein
MYVLGDPISHTDRHGTYLVCDGDDCSEADCDEDPVACSIYEQNSNGSGGGGVSVGVGSDGDILFGIDVNVSSDNSDTDDGDDDPVQYPEPVPPLPVVQENITPISLLCGSSPSSKILSSMRSGLLLGGVRGGIAGFTGGEIVAGPGTLGLSGVGGAVIGAVIGGTIGAAGGVFKGVATAAGCSYFFNAYSPSGGKEPGPAPPSTGARKPVGGTRGNVPAPTTGRQGNPVAGPPAGAKRPNYVVIW